MRFRIADFGFREKSRIDRRREIFVRHDSFKTPYSRYRSIRAFARNPKSAIGEPLPEFAAVPKNVYISWRYSVPTAEACKIVSNWLYS
jgi:hypothetical protein